MFLKRYSEEPFGGSLDHETTERVFRSLQRKGSEGEGEGEGEVKRQKIEKRDDPPVVLLTGISQSIAKKLKQVSYILTQHCRAYILMMVDFRSFSNLEEESLTDQKTVLTSWLHEYGNLQLMCIVKPGSVHPSKMLGEVEPGSIHPSKMLGEVEPGSIHPSKMLGKWNPVPFIPAKCWEKWTPVLFPAKCWEKLTPVPFNSAKCWTLAFWINGTGFHFSQHFAGTGVNFSQHFVEMNGTGFHFPSILLG